MIEMFLTANMPAFTIANVSEGECEGCFDGLLGLFDLDLKLAPPFSYPPG
jgi:hypothetical protein